MSKNFDFPMKKKISVANIKNLWIRRGAVLFLFPACLFSGVVVFVVDAIWISVSECRNIFIQDYIPFFETVFRGAAAQWQETED